MSTVISCLKYLRKFYHNQPFVNNLQFFNPKHVDKIPAFRVLSPKGEILNNEFKTLLTNDQIIAAYKYMLQLSIMDKYLYESHRQGRISFYMQCVGEEATHIGTAMGLSNDDLIYAQYREQGVLLWRGFEIQQFADQCFGNIDDIGKGRQMPVHYGSKKLNFVTISSTLATQMPHAVGSAYYLAYNQPDDSENKESNTKCVVCYFGDGASSEGDAHAAMNFAATLQCPVVFICRNNQFAISTSTNEQYYGDGIASRAYGYGMNYIRVDGNDILACYKATKEARDYTIKNNKPILIECMTYRVGHHSTSDDSFAYRSKSETDEFESNNSPIRRLKLYLENNSLWNNTQETNAISFYTDQIKECIRQAEQKNLPPVASVFDDVYSQLTPTLKEQRDKCLSHLSRHSEVHSKLLNKSK